jgi:hypothetical protein
MWACATALIASVENATSEITRVRAPDAASHHADKKPETIATPLMTSVRVAPGSRDSVHHEGGGAPASDSTARSSLTASGARPETSQHGSGHA